MVTSLDTDRDTATPPRRIAAVTVTYNSVDVLDDFPASVTAQTGDWSLVVADNQSTDDTCERLAGLNHDCITVILNDRNTGLAGGSNTGIRAALTAGANAVILLNNDTVFYPTLFANLARLWLDMARMQSRRWLWPTIDLTESGIPAAGWSGIAVYATSTVIPNNRSHWPAPPTSRPIFAPPAA